MRTKVLVGLAFLLLAIAWFSPAPKPQAKAAPSAVEPIPPLAQLLRVASSNEHLLAQAAAGGHCNLEFPAGPANAPASLLVTSGKPVVFTGWAMNSAKRAFADQIIVRLSDAQAKLLFAFPRTGLAREDVRKHFDLPAHMANSGFDIQLDVAGIPAGIYAVDLILKFGQQSYSCGNGRKITVE